MLRNILILSVGLSFQADAPPATPARGPQVHVQQPTAADSHRVTPAPPAAESSKRKPPAPADATARLPWSELFSAVLGAVLGAMAAAWLYTREARRQMKVDTLRRFVAYRFDLTGPDFSQVLNEALVVFAGSPAVVKALGRFGGERSNAHLIQLWRAMSDAARIPHKHIPDDLFLVAFNVRHPPA